MGDLQLFHVYRVRRSSRCHQSWYHFLSLYFSIICRRERGEDDKGESVKPEIMSSVVRAKIGAYIVSVFGEGLRAGHHGCGSLLQLSQFLPPLVQSYPSTGKLSHNARRRSLHALHAPRARDVLGQAPGGLTGSCFPNCPKDRKHTSESIKSKLK